MNVLPVGVGDGTGRIEGKTGEAISFALNADFLSPERWQLFGTRNVKEMEKRAFAKAAKTFA